MEGEKFNVPQESAWSEYYEIQKDKPPSALLVEALPLVLEKDHALDLGAGAPRNTRFMLSEGFEMVTAIDRDPTVKEYFADLPQDHIEVVICPFDEFNFEKEEYDLVNAQSSLSFNPPDTFDTVFDRVKMSLKKGGIFSGNLFGVKDDWNSPETKLTFVSELRARELFSNMEILKFEEKEMDSKTVNGVPKHWHMFNIIARK